MNAVKKKYKKIYIYIYIYIYMYYNNSFTQYFIIIIFNNSCRFYLDFVGVTAGTEAVAQ